MALHSRYAVTVSAAVATPSRADCISTEDRRRKSLTMVVLRLVWPLISSLVMSMTISGGLVHDSGSAPTWFCASCNQPQDGAERAKYARVSALHGHTGGWLLAAEIISAGQTKRPPEIITDITSEEIRGHTSLNTALVAQRIIISNRCNHIWLSNRSL